MILRARHFAVFAFAGAAACAFDFDRYDPRTGVGGGPPTGPASSGGSGQGGDAGAGGLGGAGASGGGSGEVIWARSFGSPSLEVAEAAAFDADGHLWVTGSLYGAVDFGGGLLTSQGNADIVLLELDADGNHLFSAVFGDTQEDYPFAMAAHGEGVVVGGRYLGSLDFGGSCAPLASVGGVDGFIARFGGDGACICAASIGGSMIQEVTGVAVDAVGDIWVTGMFFVELFVEGAVVATAAGDRDAFAMRFDEGCALEWTQPLGGAGSDWSFGIAVTADGRLRLGMDSNGDITFGPFSLVNQGGDDAFTLGFTAAGTPEFFSSLTGTLHQFAPRLAALPNGAVWASNSLQGATHHASGSLEGDAIFDAYLLRLGPDGAVEHAAKHGGSGLQRSEAIVALPDDGVMIAGIYDGAFAFDGGEMLTLNGGTDIFLARFGADGEHLWSLGAGGPFLDEPEWLAVDGSGRVAVVGSFESSLELGNRTLAGVGDQDWFVVVMAP